MYGKFIPVSSKKNNYLFNTYNFNSSFLELELKKNVSQRESQLQSKWNLRDLVRFNEMRICKLKSYLKIAHLSSSPFNICQTVVKVYYIFLITMSSSHYLPLLLQSDRQSL